MNRVSSCVFVVMLLAALASPAAAQSPNNAALLVVVSDQAGLIVPGASVVVTNTMTGAVRETQTGEVGTANIGALPLTGSYRVKVAMSGFADETLDGIVLRANETATVRVKLVASGGSSEVTVYGTTQGVRADSQIGRRVDSSTIDETPILGRKLTSLPLFDSAFRQGKGTGDLFVNATYFVTGGGSRRATTYMLDGTNNNEGWGRQTMIATVPVGAVEEVTVLANAFSAEFGWTAGPTLNIVTKSGTNAVRGEGLFMGRPSGLETKTLSTDNFCPPTVASCQVPSTLVAINPADVPDVLKQYSVSFGAPITRDRTFLFLAVDSTHQDRTSPLSSSLPSFVLPADGSMVYVGHYVQTLVNGRVDHKLSQDQSLFLRVSYDHFYDTNPNDAVGGTSAPSVARQYSRGSYSAQLNHTAVLSSTLLNEARLLFLDGDPVTKWDAQALSTAYTRSGSVPFTIGQSRQTDVFSRSVELSDALTWSKANHTVRFGAGVTRHMAGGSGSEPGQATLGTFTFKSTTTAPFDQLTLADVQSYSQPISFGITNYDLRQWLLVGYVQDRFRVNNDLTLDLGLRYDRQTLTSATRNFEPRLGFAWHPGGDSRLAIRGGYAMYYTQIRANQYAGALTGGLEGLTTYSATPGQFGFPTCLTGPCLPVVFDPKTLPASQLPARNITIEPGKRAFYEAQFAQYGLNFDLLPYYPDSLVNPRSQVTSVGAEREIVHGWFLGADYVHQYWSGLDRTVDLNAATPFVRTDVGQVRTVAAANLTRPILPVNGGVTSVNVLMNLGTSWYNGLQTQLSYRGSRRIQASISYTLSKATNTYEPDGNGVSPNDPNIVSLGNQELGPSLLDQRHRAVVRFTYLLPLDVNVGMVGQFASGRPFNAVTGVDNNGDGSNNDRPVINGQVIGKSAFQSTPTQDVSLFFEKRIALGRNSLMLRAEVFNVFNHVNILGRAQTTYGDTGTPNSTFGQVVAAGTATNALPSLSNIDPARMWQFQVRYLF